MGLTVTKEKSLNDVEYVIIALEGDFSGAAFREHADTALKLILDQNCEKLLYDFRKTVFKLSTFEIIQIHKNEEELLLKNGISLDHYRRAIVTPHELNFFSDLFFIRVISASRVQNLKQFSKIEEAIDWLTQG